MSNSNPRQKTNLAPSSAVKRFATGRAFLTVGFGLISVCGLVRSIIIARAISVEDYGIAAALLAALAVIKMSTAIAPDKQILQDPAGGSDAFLATAHTIAVLRGFLSGSLLYLMAAPATYFFDLPDLLLAFHLVALASVIMGFTHYDLRALQPQADHRLAVTVTAAPELIVTALVVPALTIWSDYKVVLFFCPAILVIKFSSCILSRGAVIN